MLKEPEPEPELVLKPVPEPERDSEWYSREWKRKQELYWQKVGQEVKQERKRLEPARLKAKLAWVQQQLTEDRLKRKMLALDKEIKSVARLEQELPREEAGVGTAAAEGGTAEVGNADA